MANVLSCQTRQTDRLQTLAVCAEKNQFTTVCFTFRDLSRQFQRLSKRFPPHARQDVLVLGEGFDAVVGRVFDATLRAGQAVLPEHLPDTRLAQRVRARQQPGHVLL